MSIIISRDGRDAVRLDRTVIEQEEYLQRYIYANPDVLPLHDLKDDLRLLILAREFPTGSGPIDALGIDGDGDIYIIETKLYKNPDKRLVLAQALDYGASLWKTYSDPGEFLTRLDQYAGRGLNKTMTAALRDYFQLDEASVTELVEAVRANLAAGYVRFIVLMDSMDERLKHLISFVNTNSKFDIIGVELDYYQHDGFEIIIPSLYGTEAKKEGVSASVRSGRRLWDKDQFFDDARARLAPDELSALDKLFEWTTQHANEYTWGTGAKRGSFSAKFTDISPQSVFSAYTDGSITLNLDYILKANSPQIATDLATTLRGDGFPVSSESGHPTIKASEWTSNSEELIRALNSVLKK